MELIKAAKKEKMRRFWLKARHRVVDITLVFLSFSIEEAFKYRNPSQVMPFCGDAPIVNFEASLLNVN